MGPDAQRRVSAHAGLVNSEAHLVLESHMVADAFKKEKLIATL